MRIGLLLNNPSPHQVDLLNAFSEYPGVEAFVGYVYKSNPIRTWGAPKPRISWSYIPARWGQVLAGGLRRWLRDQHVDIWVVASVYTNPITHVVCWYLHMMGMQYVYMGEPPRPRTGLRRLIQKLLLSNVLRYASGIVATGKEAARRYGLVTKGRIPVISVPYYLDLKNIQVRPMLDRTADKGEIRFLVCAQLIYRKGLDVLIDACRQLPADGWCLDIYGAGPLEEQLKKQAKGVSDAIKFCGEVPFDERHRIFRRADVFVFPTRWDGWGMAIVEAMAHGLPVISTNQAMSAHDFVIDGKNGYIGPTETPDFFSGSMKKFLDGSANLGDYSIESKSALTNYIPEEGVRRLIEFIGPIVENRLPGAENIPT